MSKQREAVVLCFGDFPVTIPLDPSWSDEEAREFLINRFREWAQHVVELAWGKETWPSFAEIPKPQHFKKMADLALKKGRCEFNPYWFY